LLTVGERGMFWEIEVFRGSSELLYMLMSTLTLILS